MAPLGTRQVAEVQIRTVRAESALTIPKETVRRQEGQTGAFVLEVGRVRWRPLKLGLASVARVEVLDGLTKEDAVARPAGSALSDGMAVTPVFP